MNAPSPAMQARLRPVIGAQWINLGLCVSLLAAAFALVTASWVWTMPETRGIELRND